MTGILASYLLGILSATIVAVFLLYGIVGVVRRNTRRIAVNQARIAELDERYAELGLDRRENVTRIYPEGKTR